MLDSYLRKQNKFLIIISVLLFVISFIVGTVVFSIGHPVLGLLLFSITLCAVGGNIKIICQNIKYIEKWNAINDIEQSSFDFDDPDGVRVMQRSVGNLEFKFRNDDD